jgi:KDO2-lipid IV(A) lauroyltransferase
MQADTPHPMSTFDRLQYRIVKSLARALGLLPFSMRERAAVVLGRLMFALDAKHRRIAIANLTRAFGGEKSEAQIRRIAQRVFENLFRILFEVGWSLRLRNDQLADYFTVSGVSDYQKAMAKGKGVLLLGAHFGNWEIQMVAAHLIDMPMRVVYRTLDAKGLDRFVLEYRSRFGAKMISNERGAIRKIYAALRKGYPVGLLMDQNVDWYEGVFVDFFGHRACTNTGMAVLALKSEAPVIPFFLIRRGARFECVLGPELPLIKTGDQIKDLEMNTRLYNQVIETYARRYPDQWFWVHQRWKTRPHCLWPNPELRLKWLKKMKTRAQK